jgi:hypothetical protein
MSPRRLAAVLTATLPLVLASPAHASVQQESTFQDDPRIVYASPSELPKTLDVLHSLGVDRIRVSVFWKIVAPNAGSRNRPNFNAADPGAYGDGWDRYDRIVKGAYSRGMAVNFNITSPAPLWATGSPKRQDIAETYTPSAREFDLFVRAVATRYSGSYVPGGFTPARTDLLGRPQGNASQAAPLPRVDYWTIWNEPNQAGWLTPQWLPDSRRKGRWYEAAPKLYRSLVAGAYDGLVATGHGGDTILIGETAPKGLNVQGITRSLKPMRFIRDLYCVDSRLHSLRGRRAKLLGCPQTADQVRAFPDQNPALFQATGFAHHPYELTFSPHRKPDDRDFVTIANLPKLTRTLNGILHHYGRTKPGGLPLYLTEFGYQTSPPDPIGVSLRRQAAYLNEAEFIAYTNPAVRTLDQFLLVDDKPIPGVSRKSFAAWGATFQSGLMYENGHKKPSFNAYRLPIHVPHPSVKRGHPVRVWGLVRIAPNGQAQQITIQFKRRGKGRKFRNLAVRQTEPTHGYVDTRVRVPGSGLIRLVWQEPGARKASYSRLVNVHVY